MPSEEMEQGIFQGKVLEMLETHGRELSEMKTAQKEFISAAAVEHAALGQRVSSIEDEAVRIRATIKTVTKIGAAAWAVVVAAVGLLRDKS